MKPRIKHAKNGELKLDTTQLAYLIEKKTQATAAAQAISEFMEDIEEAASLTKKEVKALDDAHEFFRDVGYIFDDLESEIHGWYEVKHKKERPPTVQMEEEDDDESEEEDD